MKNSILPVKKIFQEIKSIMDRRGEDSHKAYLKLWQIIREEDRKIALMFDDLGRGNAVLKLAAWKRNSC